MFKNVDKTGVLVLVAHLIITLAIVGAYVYALTKGLETSILSSAITLILGYWFGAIGHNVIRPKQDNKSNK